MTCRWAHATTVIFGAKGQRFSCIAERPVREGGPWALGCVLCANRLAAISAGGLSKSCDSYDPKVARRCAVWATFNARGSSVSKKGVRKHCQAQFHQGALRATSGCQPGADWGHIDRVDGVCAGTLVGEVPRPDRFVAAILSTRGGESARAFAKHTAIADLTSALPSVGVLRDGSPKTHQKCLACASTVLLEEDQTLLKSSVRLAFSEDDRDQVRILRIRIVYTKPTVGTKEFFGGGGRGGLRDYGFTAEANSNATWLALQTLCCRRRGRRGPDNATSPDDAVDQQLLAHVQDICFCGASDGALVALEGIQKLRQEGLLRNLRYQFRDRPHTTRSIIRCTFAMCQESEALLESLIYGERSFAKRARYSRRFSEIWVRKQRESPTDFYNILASLSYAEQRYDNRSAPMTAFLMKFGSAVDVLVEMAEDRTPCHREDMKWASQVLLSFAGVSGFERLVDFAIDCDFAVATHKLVAMQDASSPDVSLAGAEVAECVETCHALFYIGRVFDEAPNATYTNTLLQSLRGVSRQVILDGRACEIGWPRAAESQWMRGPVRHARKLYAIAKEFMQLNFPDYSWRTKFAAFACGEHKLPTELRLGYVEELAVKEGLDPIQTRTQFECALPHLERVYKRTRDNRACWQEFIQSCCRRPDGRFRTDAACVRELAFTYLGIMDGSSDVERMFATLELCETKRSHRHHNPQNLFNLLKVALDGPRDMESLMLIAPQPGEVTVNQVTQAVSVMWKPDKFITLCQQKYAEFFGVRSLPSRSLAPCPLSERARQLASVRPRVTFKKKGRLLVGPLPAGVKYPAWHRRAMWEETARALRSDSRETPLPRNRSLLDTTPTKLPSAVRTAIGNLQARQCKEARAHAQAERNSGLALPPRAVTISSLWKSPGKGTKRLKGSTLRTDGAKAKRLCVSAVSRPGATTSAGSRVASAASQTTPLRAGTTKLVDELKARLWGLQCVCEGNMVTFHPPVGPLCVYVSPAAMKKHPQSTALLAKCARGDKVDGHKAPKLAFVTNFAEFEQSLRRAPDTCKCVMVKSEAKWQDFAQRGNVNNRKILMTMAAFCDSVGHRVSL